jgi:hypothetical protein
MDTMGIKDAGDIGKFAFMVVVFLVFSLALLPFLAAAQQEMYAVFYFSPSEPFSMESVMVVEGNSYNEPELFESVDGFTDYSVVFEGASGGVIGSYDLMEYKTVIGYNHISGASKVRIVKAGSVYFEEGISFCDRDGVCEPCRSADCSAAENVLTCADCASGSADGYCDLRADGICDPDCGFDLADPDCERRCSQDCGVEDESLLSCDDMGGSVCEPDEDCMGGWMAYTWDSMYCCVSGVCAYPNEYVQTMVTLQNQPSMVITPEGKFASTVQDYGVGDYCVEKLGGSICDVPTEYCDGKMVEYYYKTYCCVGSCARYPESAFKSDEFMFDVRNETSRPLSGEEMMSLYNFSAMESQLESEKDDFYPEEILQDLPEGDFPHEGIASLGEKPPVVSTQLLSDAGGSAAAAIGKVSENVDLLDVVLIVLGVLFLVAVCVLLFTRSASKKVKAESAGVDIQSEIDSMVSQGNDYKQVEQLLVARGVDKSVVDAEIRKNYDRRVEQQKSAGQVR